MSRPTLQHASLALPRTHCVRGSKLLPKDSEPTWMLAVALQGRKDIDRLRRGFPLLGLEFRS